MGCKQCKIFLTKHHENNHNNNNNNSTIIIEPNSNSISNNKQLTISSNEITPKICKKHKKYQFKTLDFPSLPTLDNLPVELIYHMLDQLDTYTIFTSLHNVSKRLNSILYTYDQYDLNLRTISICYFDHISSVIRPEQIISLTLSDGNDNVGLVELFLKKFQLESFKRLRSLTLKNIDDNEQMIKIFLSITDQLQILSIENSNEFYTDTVMDILMTIIGKESLYKISLDIERNRILNPSIIWPMDCFLREIKLVGLCNISLFRNILLCSTNLKKFQAYDIDFDDEWIDHDEDEDENDDDEQTEQRQMLPISNASNLTSLSLIYARNEMEKLEWLLPQLTELKYFKYLNIYDFHIESIYESDYSLLEGERWEKLLYNCKKFEFIFTVHFDDESWNVHHYLSTFQTQFWQEKNWNIVLEQYEKILLIYSLPYAHNSHYYDRPIFFSIPNNPFLLSKSMDNVTKLRINISAINNLEKQITGPPRFSHVSHLILDGQWRNSETTDSLGSLVYLSKIIKLIRLERVPTIIFRTFISHLSNLQSLTLITFVLDSLNAAVFQYMQCLYSLNIVQIDDNYRYFVNVEPFCTMFPQIKHLDIPIDNLDSCQYIIDRLEKCLISVIFRFQDNEDDDEDDEDEDEDEDDDNDDNDKYNERTEWAKDIQENHQYRINDGDIYLWLQ